MSTFKQKPIQTHINSHIIPQQWNRSRVRLDVTIFLKVFIYLFAEN